MSVFDTVLEFAPAVGMTAAGIYTANPYLIGAGVGAGVGAVKGREARAQSERAMKAEAEKTKFAPWTGQYGDISKVAPANVFGDILKGGLQGAAVGGLYAGGAAAGAGAAKGAGAGAGASGAGAAGAGAQPGLSMSTGRAAIDTGVTGAEVAEAGQIAGAGQSASPFSQILEGNQFGPANQSLVGGGTGNVFGASNQSLAPDKRRLYSDILRGAL